jgi:ribonuclease P protein component
MIKKYNRLTEREFRKVLSKRKPFFSYDFVANIMENHLGQGRFWLVLSAKCAKWSVNRNFFRRRFYSLSESYISKFSHDVVVVPKKGVTLDFHDTNTVAEFEKNIQFLYKTIEKHTYLK